MTPTEKEARLARLYDTEILPAYAARFAALLARAVEVRPAARVIEIGCATGTFTADLARRFDLDSRLTAFDASPAFIAQARAHIEAEPELQAEIVLAARADVPASIPLPDRSADLLVSNLAVATAGSLASATNRTRLRSSFGTSA